MYNPKRRGDFCICGDSQESKMSLSDFLAKIEHSNTTHTCVATDFLQQAGANHK